MSHNRCFDLPRNRTLSNYSSDYTQKIRNKTIYKDVSTKNIVKSNGAIYSGPFYLSSAGSDTSSCLISTHSHADLLNVTRGAYLCDSIPADISGNCKYDPKDGNFMVTTYDLSVVAAYTDISGVDASSNRIWPGPFNDANASADLCGNYPGVLIDPSGQWLYKNCEKQGNNFMQNVDICSNLQPGATYVASKTFAQEAKYDSTHGFTYPRCLKFD
jgi:hypothetical protein